LALRAPGGFILFDTSESRPRLALDAGNADAVPRNSSGGFAMIVRPSARRCRPRRGATVVEFAVVVPIFFALIFGIVDISRGFMVKTLIANAARAGCRTGVLQGKATSDVNAAIDSTLSGQTISGYSKTVQVNGSSGTDVSAAQAGD